MKNKKELIILVGIIVVLGLYLALRGRGEVHYQLPDLPEVKVESINRIVVEKEDGKLELKRENEKWKLLPEGYPAKNSEVKRMAEALAELKLTALAGESGGLARYMLDDKQKLTVTAFDGDTKLRAVTVGKATSTWRQTFVQLPGDPKVYHAADNLRSIFDVTTDRLRDKTVFTVDKSTVTRLTFKPATGDAFVIQRDPAAGAEGDWTTADGKPLDGAPVTRLLNAIASLNCSEFLDPAEKDRLTKPSFELSVEAAGTTGWIKLFDKTDKDEYKALSSGSDYPFLLPKWQVDQFRKKPADFPEKPVEQESEPEDNTHH